MDIRPPLNIQDKKGTASVLKAAEALVKLKLNQLLQVKVISSEQQNQKLLLEIKPSSQTLKLQSNQSLDIKSGQELNLLVSKLTPQAEFKIIQGNKPLLLNKQTVILIPDHAKTILKQSINTIKDKAVAQVSAKIISLDKNTIQLLIDPENSETYKQNKQLNRLQLSTQELNLSREQLTSLLVKPRENYQAGQRIQLNLAQLALLPSIKNQQNTLPELLKGQQFVVRIIAVENHKIEISLVKNLRTQQDFQANPTLSIEKKQLQVESDKSPSSFNKSFFKAEQQLTIEVLKTGDTPLFKVVHTQQNKTDNLINTKLLAVNQETVQLQLNSANKTETLNLKTELFIDSVTAKISDSRTFLNQLKRGQSVEINISKVAQQLQQQKITDSIRHFFPLQSPPSELTTQLMQKLPVIQENENIPTALKRLAREILDTIPKTENLTEHKSLQKALNQSGLFLEAKLAYALPRHELNLSTDLKALLLKFQQALKTHLSTEKQSKTDSLELSVLKEIFQKTESTLANSILNQLISLPKEDSNRQVWLLELPFLNQDKTENVKVEINKEKKNNNPDDQENWTVSIKLSPPGLAPIQCKLSSIEETINTQFSSESHHVVKKINDNLDYLKTQFEKTGLKPGHLSARKAASEDSLTVQIKKQTLFDQKV